MLVRYPRGIDVKRQEALGQLAIRAERESEKGVTNRPLKPTVRISEQQPVLAAERRASMVLAKSVSTRRSATSDYDEEEDAGYNDSKPTSLRKASVMPVRRTSGGMSAAGVTAAYRRGSIIDRILLSVDLLPGANSASKTSPPKVQLVRLGSRKVTTKSTMSGDPNAMSGIKGLLGLYANQSIGDLLTHEQNV